MTCPNCKSELPEGAAFCTQCGTPMAGDTAAPAAGPTQAPPMEPLAPPPTEPFAPAAPSGPSGDFPPPPPAKERGAEAGAVPPEAEPPVRGPAPTRPSSVPPQKRGGGGSSKAIIIAIAVAVGIVVGVIVFFVLRAVTAPKEADSSLVPASSAAVSASQEDVASASLPVSSSAGAQPWVGVYAYDGGGDYSAGPPDYRPKVWLGEDGYFAGISNLLEGMGWMEGTYTVSGDTVSVTITSASYFDPAKVDPSSKGWWNGSDTASMTIMDGDTLTLDEPDHFLGDSPLGARFVRSGEDSIKKPEQEPGAGAGPSVIGTGKVTADGGLHLRSGPGQSNDSYGLIPSGSTVELYEKVTGTDGKEWYFLRYEGKEGYASAEYIE